METNFFSQIKALKLTGVLHLLITPATTEGSFVVSVLLKNEQCGDKAKELLSPANLTGTAEQLDSLFFAQVSTPIQASSELQVNMEAFMKQMEEAKLQSAMEKEKAEKEKKAKEEREKKYKEAMAKVDELEKAGEFRKALDMLPDVSLHTEQQEKIHKRRAELSAKVQPDLFTDPQPDGNNTEIATGESHS